MANVYSQWKNKREIKITDPSSTEGVQAKITLPYSKLPGVRFDYRDIRFSDKNGQPLPYWIESKTDFSTAEVWVKLPAADQKIYLYYGNGAAVSESDGDAVFEFFDDFSGSAGEDPDSEKWTVHKLGSASSTAQLDENGNIVLSADSSKKSSVSIVSIHTFTRGVVIEYRNKVSDIHYADTGFGSGDIQGETGSASTAYHHTRLASGYNTYVSDLPYVYLQDVPANGGPVNLNQSTSLAFPSTNTYYTHKITWANTNALTWTRDTTTLATATDSTHASGTMRLAITQGANGTGRGGTRTVGYINVRKYTATQPTLTLSRKHVHFFYVESSTLDQLSIPGTTITSGPSTPLTENDQLELPSTAQTLTPTAPEIAENITTSLQTNLTSSPANFVERITIPGTTITVPSPGSTPPVHDEIIISSTISITPSAPASRVFINLELYSIESINISRSITDSFFQLDAHIVGTDCPNDFSDFNWEATDASGNTQHLFVGVITEPSRSYELANNGIDITAYDYGWYLSAQKVPLDMLVMDLDGSRNSWDDWVEDLLEDTGVVDWKINNSGYHENNVQQSFNPTTSKLDAIKKICELTGFIFYVKPVNTGTEESPVWRSGAYFIDPDDIDDEEDGLDLPEPVVITWPDDTLVGIPSVSGNPEERINRVTVRGVDDDGNWYTSIEESANVTAGEAYPREYYEESADWNTQAKCDARAQRLYAYFNIGSTAIQCTFKKRFDLRLWQLISFSGAGFDTRLTTMPPLRIVSIQYSQRAGDDTVTITAAPDRDMNLLQTGTTDVINDNITDTERVVKYEMAKTPSPIIGTVISIDGNIATVETEDGRTIDVRIVQ